MTPRARAGQVDARGRLPLLAEAEGSETRPRTRADCLAGGSNAQRPCPWVSCAAHLALELRAHGDTASVRVRFPGVAVWEMAETCALDVADRGGATRDEVAALLNLTPARAAQVEALALARVGRAGD